jgi:hypothetical protein
MLLTGFYGWLWLAGAVWVIGRFALAVETPFTVVFRLFGFAHRPLLVVAITIQFVAVVAQILGPGVVVAAFSVVLWLPALLVQATRQAFDLDTRRAVLLVAAPYAMWLLVVGSILNDQLGHLL